MAVITIVGAGMMGSALAFPARENGHTVRLTGTHLDRDIIETSIRTGRHPKFEKDFPAGIDFHQIEDLEKVIDGADMLICGVSSFGVDWFAEKVLPVVPESLPVLSVTKGLFGTEEGRLLCYPEYWSQKIGPQKRRLNAVGGACTSYELVARDPTIVTFCGDEIEVLRRMRDLMQTPYYHISVSTDVMGVESAVALKNAYAMGVTIAIGYNEKVNAPDTKPHYNSQAAVFAQSLKEMRELLGVLAGSDRSLDVGIGDLYVTVFSGRTRFIGSLLGRGYSFEDAMKQLEGITMESTVITERMYLALTKMSEQGLIDLERFPLMKHMGQVICEGRPVDIPWNSFTDNGP